MMMSEDNGEILVNSKVWSFSRSGLSILLVLLQVNVDSEAVQNEGF